MEYNNFAWETVGQAKCEKYIGNLQTVIPKVIELEKVQQQDTRHSYFKFILVFIMTILTVLAIIIIMA